MTVYLVGAGPGDPGLLTVRGAELLARADVVLYDRLVDDSLLELAPSGAELLDVGKHDSGEPEDSGRRQDRINELLVEHGGAGRSVVRLKGGDPFVFGRGGEEAEALTKAGVSFEVVPGVTSATAVPAAAGIPVTHRGLSSSVTFVTGRVGDPSAPGGVDWASLAKGGGTIVILMGMAARAQITDALVRGGRAPDTPVAVVEWGTTDRQRISRVPLSELPSVQRSSPAIIVVGPVAALSLTGAQGPLKGRSVVVTRPSAQSSELVGALREAGATVVSLPLIAIAEPQDRAALDAAVAELVTYEWVVFTSANAVAKVLARVRDARSFAGVRLAAVGRATARALEEHGLRADLVPAEERAEGLVRVFPNAQGATRVLYPRAERASGAVADALSAKGWHVDEVIAYRTEALAGHDHRSLAAAAAADAVVFASPSALEAYAMLRDESGRAVPFPHVVVCIGPVTADAARQAGCATVLLAASPDAASLIAALSGHFTGAGTKR